ncbi:MULTISPECIES: nicotinate-nicotinamide nucleotide adenylyltransferase [unclassified Vibrio]|uniref:nicotinate-nucleotide adenylyltransferase n=1 Tax=Vibrio sp. HB236076 TaxID=3232307 RepID=A0AB39HLH8_9VIBR|nr:nicotinate-nicotinamide nucleotide adenylyltransferase [Vibrio sp. HB161653]MDP5252653.1 nicotinate-nicotinamide nucleotide adenylyltransferase [Vibrio sp. HB161653]
MEKIAVFGSAFNPPSLGHKDVIESLSHFDRVLLEPSIAHAWGKEMLDYATRCTLVEAFMSDLNLSNIDCLRLESELYQDSETVTTFQLLEKIQDLYPNADITFVIGPDNLLKFGQFYRANDILARWSVLACPERVSIRSTVIRQRLASGQSIDQLTTPTVAEMIEQQQLFL